jgi:PD-(D/E)XK nuclease superfamily
MEAVMLGFQAFMKKEYSKKDRDFLEKNGRLVFLAFLKPIINGSGYDFKEPQISEEKRLDVVITYFNHKYVAELKIWYGEKAHQKGLLQLVDYLNIQGLDEGYLLIFDHSETKNWQSEWREVEGKRIFAVWV